MTTAEKDLPAGQEAGRSPALRELFRRAIRQQSLVSLASFVASLIALTALIPILVRVLGTKTYGAWVLTGGIVNYITLLDFGMSLTIARFVALGYRRNRREADEAIAVGLTVVGAVGLVAIAVALLVADRWQRYLGVSGSAFALRTAAPALLALLLSKVLQSALEGAGQVALSRLIQAAGAVSFAAAAATVVVVASSKLEALSVVLVANAVLLLLAYAFFLVREWQWTPPIAVPARSAWRQVTTYALTMQGGSIIGFAVDPISRYILAAVGGPAAVTPLDIALRTSAQWFGGALAFTRPVLPELGHLAGTGDAVAERADLVWRRFFDVAIATAGFLAGVVYFTFPTLFGDVGHYAGRLAAVAVLLWTASVVTIIPYLYIVLYGRARNILAIQAATSGVGIVMLFGFVWSLHAWAPVLGMGTGAVVGAAVTQRLARARVGATAAFSSFKISPLALAAPVVAAAVFELPLPLALGLPLATLAWFCVALKPITALFRTL